MQGGTGMGWVGSKTSKLISAPFRGARLKFRPAPSLPYHLCGAGKPHLGRSEESRIMRSRTKLSSLITNETPKVKNLSKMRVPSKCLAF